MSSNNLKRNFQIFDVLQRPNCGPIVTASAPGNKKTKSTNGKQDVGIGKVKATPKITCYFPDVIPTTRSAANNESPWSRKLQDKWSSNRSLCLSENAVRDEITHFVPMLDPSRRYLLALIYMPGSSVTNEDHLDNKTSLEVIEPILGKNYYTVEFIDLSVPVNGWVDLYRVKRECANPDSWMVQDYNYRLERCFAFREEHSIPVDLFVGGPDATAALKTLLCRFTQVGDLPVFVRSNRRGHLVTVTVAVYHPSAGIMSGDPQVQADIRYEFCLYKAVCNVSEVARECNHSITAEAISAELKDEQRRRSQAVKENIRVLHEFLQGNQEKIEEVMNRFPSIGYHGVQWAANTVAHLEARFDKSVTIAERTMLTTKWLWEEKHHVHAIDFLKVRSMEEYLMGVTTCGSFAGLKTAPQTAEGLTRAGFSTDLMLGAGGSAKAQAMLLPTAEGLTRAGFSTDLMMGKGGSAIALQSVVQTATAFVAAGVSLSRMKGAGGSSVARKMYLCTHRSLLDNDLPESLLASDCSHAAKAQGSIVATALELRSMNFSNNDITLLLKDNSGSFSCQQALLVAVRCLRLNTSVKKKTIVKLLRGDKSSSTKTIQDLGKKIKGLLAAGIGEDVLVARLGNARSISRRLSCANKIH